MTRNNLDEHLAWLLQTKGSIPSAESALPAVALSFTSTSANSALPSQDDVEAPQPPQSAAEAPPVSEPAKSANMARLRTAPASAAKPSLISMGPRLPDTASTIDCGTPGPKRPIASAYSTAQSNLAQTPGRRVFGTPRSARNVDIMDLTESMEQLSSPSRLRGRKRKSSELELGVSGPLYRSNSQVPANGALPTASQQSFTAIDEIMNEPMDPPPPYSTIASRPASPARDTESSSTLAPLNLGMSDLDDNDDERLVQFARKAPKREDEVPSHASSAKCPQVASPKPSDQNTRAPLLSQFLALSDSQVNELIGKANAHNESLVDAVFNLLDAEDEATGLQEEVKRSSDRCDALIALSSKRDDYRRLTEEKEQTAAALKHAIRTQQRLEDAKAANSTCKAKLQQVEVECMSYLQTCQKDVENYIESLDRLQPNGETKRIAVHSTQTSALPQRAAELSVPSSSRIAQTQMAKADRTPANPGVDQRDSGALESGANNIEAYFSPSRKRTANISYNGRQAQPAFDTGNDQRRFAHDVDEWNHERATAGEVDLFSNRMGTPPAPYIDQEEDDFGMGDDDEMLELVENVENRGVTRSGVGQTESRSVFAEVANNRQRKATNMSAKKTKRAFTKPDDPNMEQLFRFQWSTDVKKTLKERFRLKGFRENQLQAINATLAGKDTFVLMPTGGGKSLCYQLPALIHSGKTIGVTVVVSPLLSLMEDQVQHLRNLQIQAFLINGDTKAQERNAIFEALNERDVETFVQLLYITPEMLAKSATLTNMLEKLYHRQRLARLVIDEAHCVSQWGHDFRPDYKQIGDVRRKFPEVPVMALTATATENVKVDTIHNLSIAGCEVYTQSFNRANLYYEVREKAKGKADIQDIADLINEKHSKQTGIIYCFSKKDCEDIAKALSDQHRIKAQHYHAALKPEEKSEVQRQWQAGKIHVIVATIAFGMGIDKPDVRFVIHHTIPKSLEGYYQETGRAGRDQKRSGCYLFYGYKDAGKIRRMIDDGEGSWEQIQRQREMFRTMIQYCENRSDCRRVQVLRYFSENFHRDGCGGACDNCNSTSSFETVDFTSYARQAINLVRQIFSDRVTLQHCIDVFCESKSKKVSEKGHDMVKEYGAGKDLDRENVERLFSRLLSDEALKEVNVVNKMGFANQYVEVGHHCRHFDQGKAKLEMQVRTTPRAKQKAPLKKAAPKKASRVDEAAKRRPKMNQASAMRMIEDLEDPSFVHYPMSTNVSSPMQAASTRKQAKKPVRSEVHNNGYYRDDFVISDPEDGDYAEGGNESSSDAFEPIRVYGEPQQKKVKTAGPPITSDRVMEDLDETHRDVVGNFVMTAREIAKRIAFDKSLRTVPFTDTVLRAMAINFTESEEQMLQIPGIDPERVRLYGKQFCKEVAKCRKFYEEIMADKPDPNDRNVIDLVSDDEDDYGSIGSSDFEGEDDEGEPSEYFHPTKAVENFNAQFAQSQSAAMRESATSQPKAKAQPKSKKRNYRATASAGTATGRRSAGGPRQTSRSYNNYGGPSDGARQQPFGKRQNDGGSRRGSFVRRGGRVGTQSRGRGISAMPT